jgi:chemotaxis protein CheD
MTEMKVAANSEVLKTVVGSCIALCMWDNIKRVGGMVHIMYPQSNGNITEPRGKYADTAVEALLSAMFKRGCKKENITAICAGGASMFNYQNINNITIGEKNYQIIKECLSKFNILLKTKEVGGTSGRRVVMNTSDGRVMITTLDNQSTFTIKKNSK